jgi:hypothetical protein
MQSALAFEIMIFIPSPECTKGAAQRSFNFAVSGQKSNFTSLSLHSFRFVCPSAAVNARRANSGLPAADRLKYANKRLAGAKCSAVQSKAANPRR